MSILPIQALIDEHKLILRMVAIVKNQAQKIRQTDQADLDQIETIVDFFRTYADRYHHGKEEGILFNQLSSKKLSASDKAAMNGLIMDHATARKTVTALKTAKDKQDSTAINQALTTIAELYPKHIEKEDNYFFPQTITYFSPVEQEVLRNSCSDFDKNFINKKYMQTVTTLENTA